MNLDSFEIFGLTLHTYGLILGLAIVLGLAVVEWVVDGVYGSNLIKKKEIEKASWLIVLLGILGARIYHVVDYWDYYRQNILEILYLWEGGLGIYGAIMGGVLGILVYVAWGNRWKIKGTEFYKKTCSFLDVASVGLPLSQAVGRLGNFINQELYGRPTDLPWGVYIKRSKRVEGFSGYEYFHPLFLYEALWNVIGFVLILTLMRKKMVKVERGNYFLIYLVWYSAGRSFLEPMRLRYWQVGGMPVATIIGWGLIILSGILIYQRKTKNEW